MAGSVICELNAWEGSLATTKLSASFPYPFYGLFRKNSTTELLSGRKNCSLTLRIVGFTILAPIFWDITFIA